MPVVDVIIPAYNAERFLAAAIDSVIEQTFTDWRIVLVNDGSTDSTADIASRYSARLGDRMLVITQRNAGLPAARNAAIRASSGEFIAILDADDVWLPCRLAASLRAIENRPEVGLSYGLVTLIDDNGEPFETFKGNRRHAEGRIAPYIYMRQVEFPCPSVTFRRSCIEKVGYFDERMRATEDRDLWLRIALQYEVAFVPEVIAYYRRSSGSMSTDLQRMKQAQLRFIRKHYGSPGCGLMSRLRATSRVYKQQAEGFNARGHRSKALLNAVQCCVVWPFSVANLRSAGSLALASLTGGSGAMR